MRGKGSRETTIVYIMFVVRHVSPNPRWDPRAELGRLLDSPWQNPAGRMLTS
jgi:hypothetical protein